jgi:type II secretory pathway component GspD/PulD (secretin)
MKFICGLAALSLLAWAQDAPPKTVRKLIPVKYVSACQVRGLLASYMGNIQVGKFSVFGQVQCDEILRTLVVSGPEEMVATYEEALKKMDVQPTDFELTIYLLSSSSQSGDQLPDALASTVKQLHGVFAYKGYQLLGVSVLRGRDGQKGSAAGTISKDGKTATYMFRYESALVSGDTLKTVNLHDLNLTLQSRTGTLTDGKPVFQETGLQTDIDVRDGQKVVVGKSDVNNGESPLILVVTAKVLE